MLGFLWNGSSVASRRRVPKAFAWGVLGCLPGGALGAPKPLTARIANSEAAVPFAEPPTCLDPAAKLNGAARFWFGHLYEGLFGFDEKGRLSLGAVDKIQVSPDGLRIVFTLRNGHKWHDGKPVVAKDYEYAWQRLVAPDSVSDAALMAVAARIQNAAAIVNGKMPPSSLGAKAQDARTLEVRLEAPTPQFRPLVASPAFLPVRRDLVEKYKESFACQKESIIGNGPFRITRWDGAGGARAERVVQPKGMAQLAAIESVAPLAGAAAQHAALTEGVVDLATLDKEKSKQAEQEGRPLQLADEGSLFWLELNMREGSLFSQPRLRKALQLLLDRDDFVRFLVATPGTRAAAGVIPDFLPGARLGSTFRAEAPLSLPPPNPDEARKLVTQHLKAAAVPRLPPINFLIDDAPIQKQFADYFREKMMRVFDTEIRVESLSFEARRQRTADGRFDIAFSGWQADILDPANFLEPFLSTNDQNHAKFSNSRYDEAVKSAAHERIPAKRVRLLADAERILVVEQSAVIPLYQRSKVWISSPGLEGVRRLPVGPDPDLRFARWKRK